MIPLTCQFERIQEAKGLGGRILHKHMPCGRVVRYRWTPRTRPENFRYLCRTCGEQAAGNFKEELSELQFST